MSNGALDEIEESINKERKWRKGNKYFHYAVRYLSGIDVQDKEFIWRLDKDSFPTHEMPFEYLGKHNLYPVLIDSD